MSAAVSLSSWVGIGRLVGDHLWQSTLFAALAALLTLAFRSHRAQVRYGLWLAASLKFLIPFAALVALGSHLGWRRAAPLAQHPAAIVIEMNAMSQPFSRIAAAPATTAVPHGATSAVPVLWLAAIWLCGCAAVLLAYGKRWSQVAAVVRAATPIRHGRELDALRRVEQAPAGSCCHSEERSDEESLLSRDSLRREILRFTIPAHANAARAGDPGFAQNDTRYFFRNLFGVTTPIALRASDQSLEPGVFGILKPVLLWPRNISEHLTDAQIEAILAHELAHVRRRDNLASTLHMAVQALFWFHPLVWWMGARIVDERERACDEEVLRLGGEPEVYAEGLLKVCKLYVEAPVACVAGVTGSDLKKRGERILRNRAGETLRGWRKILLATAGVRRRRAARGRRADCAPPANPIARSIHKPARFRRRLRETEQLRCDSVDG